MRLAVETPPKPRRRWPLVLYSAAGLIAVLLLWLVLTAPLSRALEPLKDPALLISATMASRSPPRRDQGSAGRRHAAEPGHAGGLRRDRGSPLLPALGDRPARHRQGNDRQPSRWWSPAGRINDHPAARQDQFPVRRPDHQAQGAGGDHRLLARGVADQAGDTLALSVERLLR